MKGILATLLFAAVGFCVLEVCLATFGRDMTIYLVGMVPPSVSINMFGVSMFGGIAAPFVILLYALLPIIDND